MNKKIIAAIMGLGFLTFAAGMISEVSAAGVQEPQPWEQKSQDTWHQINDNHKPELKNDHHKPEVKKDKNAHVKRSKHKKAEKKHVKKLAPNKQHDNKAPLPPKRNW